MKRIDLFVTLCVALLVAACQPDTPTIPNTPEVLSFNVEIVATTRTTMTFNVQPSRPDAEYFCYVMDRAKADDFTKDKYLVASIYQEITEAAMSEGKTFAEYMSTATDSGVIAEGSFSGLTMATEYYLIVFGVDASADYATTTELCKTLFTTAAAETSDCTFEVNATVKDNNVTFEVKPSDKDTYWYLCTLTRAQYDYYVTSEEGYGMTEDYFYQYYLQQDINAYRQAGYTDQQIIDAIIHKGDLVLEAKGLNANTEHLYLIAGMMLDTEGITITTPVSSGAYTTGNAAQSTMTFDIKVWDIEQMAASFSITPSNNTDKYCALVQPWDGVSTANEVMHQIVDQWGGWMDMMANDRGPVEHSGAKKFSLPAADTLYYIIAFGYSGGITTDAEMVTFRTLPGGSVEDVTFQITTSKITPYGFAMNVTSSDPTIYYVPGVCRSEEYDEAEFVAMEEEIFNYYYAGSKDFNPSITIAEVLDQYYYNGSAALQISGVSPDTEFMGYIYALDVHTGKVVKCFTYDNIVRTDTLGTIAPGIELVGYYSGDEENGSIFGQPSATAGKAITVVKYTDLEGVRTLFTMMVEGDCSNSVAFSEAQIWELTNGYWKTCKVSQPYSFYTADWNVEQTALAYATDMEGKMGAFARLYTLPTADTKSPVSELKELVDRLNAEAQALSTPSLVIDDEATPMRPHATITSIE